ncbi:OTU domain-containing protein 5-like isoform X1 [Gossypium australe]|uniref:OTU domain-containing protein 5-like isoform X1 n=1 Tax=Gossypium australe TaxID=47621 RepID=A0A5B6URB6_9ROSI|nr:OTU domain-containing protein 5-like isoform X1 [Gossypium australe]
MTRILVQRGSTGSSSLNLSHSSSLPGLSAFSTHQVPSAAKDGEVNEELSELVASDEHLECSRSSENKGVKDDPLVENLRDDWNGTSSDAIAEAEKVNTLAALGSCDMMNDSGEKVASETEGSRGDPSPIGSRSSHPPPPPAPPPKPSSENLNSRRFASGSSNPVRAGSSRRAVAWPVVSMRTSPSESRPSSPRSHGENEGYNSADEQSPCFVSSYGDAERERQFEIDIRLAKGLEVKRMLEDGNCLFRAVADQVYGDFEAYHLIRQMCIDYMERERDHFSQFITEGFTSYCKRKRREKVYGNNVEIQALSEMYNRPIHIYSYSIESINIFHGSYNTDTPPIRLSYHHGNHYNSLVDPRRLTIGAGLGFSCLQGTNVDKDQVKAAIKAQQDQQALLAEGRFYSDLELTEKEIERMVMEASRAEYLGNEQV